MCALDYQQLIGPLFPAWGFKIGEIGWQLQKNNAPIHVASSTLTYFKDRNIPLFQNWPSKSPDLNIMENMWSHAARIVYAEGRQYHSSEDLLESIKTAWENLEQSLIQRLYLSLPDCMRALRDAHGNSTNY